MQMDATDAFDVSKEPESDPRDVRRRASTRGRCLIARRLLERGVRFIQLYHGAGQPWDNHDDIEAGHRNLARECDQAIGALLKDLKQRGMLEERWSSGAASSGARRPSSCPRPAPTPASRTAATTTTTASRCGWRAAA